HERGLPGRELGIDALGERGILLLQAGDLVGDIDSRVRLHESQLFDFAFEFRERLLEFEKCITHRNLISRYWRARLVMQRGRIQAAPEKPGRNRTPGCPGLRHFTRFESRNRLTTEIV